MDIKQRTPPPGENQGSNLEQNHLKRSAGMEFLTFTHVNQIKDPKIQRRVRSHVMQGVMQRKGKKGDWKKLLLDITPLMESIPRCSNYPLAPTRLPSPFGLGAGNTDPFKKYPITMNLLTHELYDHCMASPSTEVGWEF